MGIKLNHVSKTYMNKKALDDVSYDFPQGKIIGLVGPNGAGKTTLIKCLVGLITDYSGEISIEGKRPGLETKGMVAYLPDRPAYELWMTVKDVLKAYEDFYEDFNSEKAVSLLELLEIRLNKKTKKLSKGEYERMQLIFTMSRKAAVYVLDEPIAGVDPLARDLIIKTILTNYQNGGTLIISTHLIEDIESVIEEVVFLDKGKIIMSGSVDELRQTHNHSIDEIFREAFKC